MDPEAILRKTAKGRATIESRAHRIESKHRMVLILVDGSTSAGDLAEKVANLGDALAILDALRVEGFIEIVANLRGAPPGAAAERRPASAGPPRPGSQPTSALTDLQRAASKVIGKLMGPDGDTFSLKLERTRTLEEFHTEATRVRAAIGSFLGPRQADEFWNALGLD